MGYTNYWHKYNDFTDTEWKQIKEDLAISKTVVGHLIEDQKHRRYN